MDKCKKCKNKIDPIEIYGDWFYCRFCNKEWTYHAERLSPEDHVTDIGKMICDSPNSENK